MQLMDLPGELYLPAASVTPWAAGWQTQWGLGHGECKAHAHV